MEYKYIAEKLEITPQTINSWLRKKRSIPKNRAKQLSKIFDGLKPELFGKELDDDEKEYIERWYKNEKAIQFFEDLRIDPNKSFSYQEMSNLILSLYQKLLFVNQEASLFPLQLDLIKKLLNLLIEDESNKHTNLLWDVIDLLEDNDNGFYSDLREIVMAYLKD